MSLVTAAEHADIVSLGPLGERRGLSGVRVGSSEQLCGGPPERTCSIPADQVAESLEHQCSTE